VIVVIIGKIMITTAGGGDGVRVIIPTPALVGGWGDGTRGRSPEGRPSQR
jgi:hypothetical protein